ncbi:hypothetical protein CCO02nite_28640 [Cellulomonas composti]|uniref:Helix-hairpin-helix DNA-binding motif class 1 domain-containing protein n=2 Tax=Cellulomonas composti TaxID=266130 RepID=A0A511JE44_9CELL|nr:hypothetical protein CCO02nite_28640 [Cellulomonas composti]
MPHAPAPHALAPRTSGALEDAARRYATAYGELPGPEPRRRRYRWALDVRTAVVAVVALALVAGGVALRVAAGRPGAPVVLPVPAPTTSAPAQVEADPDATVVGELVVDVVGAVTHPGVVRLPAGARVVDALAAAGGALPEADLPRLNLARPLVDGEQVVVLRPGEQPASAATVPDGAAPDAPAVVDLNTADAAALDALPGIGPVLAARIVEYRAEHPFGTVDDLEDVPGIGPTLLEELRDLVRV